jgi:hypothetical protein
VLQDAVGLVFCRTLFSFNAIGYQLLFHLIVFTFRFYTKKESDYLEDALQIFFSRISSSHHNPAELIAFPERNYGSTILVSIS